MVRFIHSFRIALHPVATGCNLTRCSNASLASQREARALFVDKGRPLAGPQLTVTGIGEFTWGRFIVHPSEDFPGADISSKTFVSSFLASSFQNAGYVLRSMDAD
jgi:hypothetical protein